MLTKGEMMPLLEGFWEFRAKWRRKYVAEYMREKRNFVTHRVLDEYTPEDKFFLAHKEEFSRLLCSMGNIHTSAVRTRESIMKKEKITDEDIQRLAECDMKIEEYDRFRERKDRWEEKHKAALKKEYEKRKEDYRRSDEYLSRTDEKTRKRNKYLRELYKRHKSDGTAQPSTHSAKPRQDRKKSVTEPYVKWIEYLLSTYDDAKTEYIRIAKARMILRVAEILAGLGKGYAISTEIRKKAEEKVTHETRQELIRYLSAQLNRRYVPREQTQEEDEEDTKPKRPYEGSIYDLE